MRFRLLVVELAAALVGFVFVSGSVRALAAGADSSTVAVPVRGTGTLTDPATGTQQSVTFDGTFNVRRFSARGNEVFAVGTLDGNIMDGNNAVVSTLQDEPVRLTAQRIETSCQVFRVALGPVNVDVEVSAGAPPLQELDMDTIAIQFNADAMSNADLTSTVMCGVANLVGTVDLSGGSSLPVSAQTIARVLNQAVRVLA